MTVRARFASIEMLPTFFKYWEHKIEYDTTSVSGKLDSRRIQVSVSVRVTPHTGNPSLGLPFGHVYRDLLLGYFYRPT